MDARSLVEREEMKLRFWRDGRADGSDISDLRYAMTLWYPEAPLTQLLADVGALGQGLRGNAIMRVYTNQPHAPDALQALCAAHGFVLSPNEVNYERGLYSRYYFVIGGPDFVAEVR
jgi:hypothetical protein